MPGSLTRLLALLLQLMYSILQCHILVIFLGLPPFHLHPTATLLSSLLQPCLALPCQMHRHLRPLRAMVQLMTTVFSLPWTNH